MINHPYRESGSGFCGICDDMPGEGEHAPRAEAPQYGREQAKPMFPWRQTREARDRVQEYLRQRKPQHRDLGNIIHNIWTDSTAEMASLTIDDVEAVLSRLERVEASLAACQESLMKYEG